MQFTIPQNLIGKSILHLSNLHLQEAAYDNSFYDFYTLYKDTPAGKSVATNLNLLTSKVTTQTTDSSSSALAMLYLSKNIKSLLPGSNTVILTDADVDGGNSR